MNQNLSSLQFQHTDAENTSSGYHRVSAIKGDKKVGSIDWDGNETGRVNMVHVDEGHRRQGIATALWQQAQSTSQEKGLTPPKHSDDKDMSVQGKAWSKSVK